MCEETMLTCMYICTWNETSWYLT